MNDYDRELTELRNKVSELERKNSDLEQQICECSEFNESVINSLPMGMDIIDYEGRIVFASKKLEALAKSPLTGSICWKTYRDDQTQCSDCLLKKGIVTGGTAIVESEGILDGRTFQLIHTGIVYRGKKSLLRIFYDITGLREAERRYRSLFEDSPISLWEEDLSQVKAYLNELENSGVSDFDTYFRQNPAVLSKCIAKTRIIDVNKATLKLYGACSKEEFLHLSDFLDEDSFGKISEFLVAIARGDKSFEFETINRTLSGERKNMSIKMLVAPSYEKTLSKVIVSIIDISERKKAEKALRDSEEKFRNLSEESPNMIFINRQGRVVYANRKCEEVMGYRKAEFYSQNFDFRELIVPEAQKMVQRKYLSHLQDEEVLPYECAMLTRTGERIETICTTKLINYGGKNAILGIITDITKRKQSEKALKESEAKFRALAEDSPNMIFINQGGKVVYVNNKCEEMGYSRDEYYSADFDFLTLIAPESRSLIKQNFALHSKGKEVIPYEYTLIAKDGRKINSICTTRLITYQEENAILGIVVDITERKQAEQEKARIEAQLLQAQKMEAIGVLAGGVAHDFNNLLTVILGYSEYLLSCIDPEDPMAEDIEQIWKVGEQASSLTRRLLAFSRRQVLQSRVLDVNEMVADQKSLLARLIGEDIELLTTLEPEAAYVKADQAQLEQVIVNLAVNSRDAMNGGTLTIKTGNVCIEEGAKIHADARPGKFMCLSVIDTGEGMNKDTLGRIFEPFFTTKGVNKGTGLGLSVVYGIVKQHRGWIEVESEPGQGTRFDIYLPACFSKPDRKETRKISLQKLQGNGEWILLVEDEPEVRKFAEKMLSLNGYVVFVAANAVEALEIFERERENIQLVYSDVVLPDMPGVELAELLLVRNPRLRVLLSSGYTGQKSQWMLIQEKGFPFLAKPYSITGLLRKIRDLLTAPTK